MHREVSREHLGHRDVCTPGRAPGRVAHVHEVPGLLELVALSLGEDALVAERALERLAQRRAGQREQAERVEGLHVEAAHEGERRVLVAGPLHDQLDERIDRLERDPAVGVREELRIDADRAAQLVRVEADPAGAIEEGAEGAAPRARTVARVVGVVGVRRHCGIARHGAG